MRLRKLVSIATVGTLLVSTAAFTKAEATTVTRTYLKYNYSTGVTSSYDLVTDVSAQANARTVIGEDTRSYQTRSENNGLVSTQYGGTGFIIGDHLIATAAHCVGGASGFIEDLELSLYGNNGYKTGETLTLVEAHIPQDYTTTATTIYDYALIVVEEDLSEHTQFTLSYAYDPMNSEFVDAKLYLTGVPDFVNSVENTEGRLATGTGHIVTDLPDSTQEKLFYTIDATGGNSGGPVYLIEAYVMGTEWYYNYSAVAIHSAGDNGRFNCGPSMNLQVRQFFKNNPNIGS